RMPIASSTAPNCAWKRPSNSYSNRRATTPRWRSCCNPWSRPSAASFADVAPPRFALVAGETSGDRLGAGLIKALRSRYPDAVVEGVTGPQMQAAGCHSLAAAEELALFGVSEVIAEIPRLLRLRRRLYRHFLQQRPDVFIGIDAPAFNTAL